MTTAPQASAIGSNMGSATTAGSMEAGADSRLQFSSSLRDVDKIKGEATTLHRAGEYAAAAREFSRAAGLLECFTSGTEKAAAVKALNAVRLSLAASQLKVCAHIVAALNIPPAPLCLLRCSYDLRSTSTHVLYHQL